MGDRDLDGADILDHNNIVGDGWERELDSAEKLHQNALSLIGDRGKYNRLYFFYKNKTKQIIEWISYFHGRTKQVIG